MSRHAGDYTPYVEFDRRSWRRLRRAMPMVLSEQDLEGLRGLGDHLDLDEIAEIYLPLSRLIHLQVSARQRLFQSTNLFLGEASDAPMPFVIGVAGSVAVGKSTSARVLRALLTRWDSQPEMSPTRVDLTVLASDVVQDASVVEVGPVGRVEPDHPDVLPDGLACEVAADLAQSNDAEFAVFA